MRILLDEYMRKKKLTERQVSIMTGIPQSTVHGIKKGAMPRMDTMELLAKGLHMMINDLVDTPYLKK
ncbi:MAG TPA: XRE family transcriptional regulator [Lachnoclostridium sp.]|jgi:DNA-binding Xre family transcriptional regulator|uniref:helix-turn-helix domain-containing protein n=2 Tax=Lacrimispora sp. TaxID=2719234 RepID=UPI000EEAAF58|nr:helix-turn-helix transcriptional regulator [Lacrimispora sp.]HCD44632.1 XRE family transcriptional regulator [Lachnoclostridium sp.]